MAKTRILLNSRQGVNGLAVYLWFKKKYSLQERHKYYHSHTCYQLKHQEYLKDIWRLHPTEDKNFLNKLCVVFWV